MVSFLGSNVFFCKNNVMEGGCNNLDGILTKN